MGTSGSYGGSSKKAWKDARQQVLNLPSGGGGDGNQDDRDPIDNVLDDLWGQVGDALDSDDPTLHAPTVDESNISLPKLMPWLSGPSGGSGGSGAGAGGGGGVVRTGGGRQGTGSRRQVTRSAARGGTAIGAAYAVRQGDAGYLGELGLALSRLRSLSPIRQCAEILDAVLGEGSHPDELALRKASLESLKDVLASDEPPDEVATLRSFVASFVFELSLVELQRQVSEGAVTPADVADKERTIRRYVERRVQTIDVAVGGTVQPRELRTRAAELTKEVIRVLRARVGGTS